MGHKRLGTLPRTKKWREVVASLDRGGPVAQIAAISSDAAEGALSRATADPALIRAFWLLTQLPLAARDPDFGMRLRELGLEVGSSPQLFDVIGAFSEAIDAHTRAVGERSDLGEMAQLAAGESLSAIVGRSLPGLFGPTPEEVQQAIGRLATSKQFSDLARDARLTRQHLTYYLSRELSNHVGPGSRLRSIAEHSDFNAHLDQHCRETARIVKEFAGDWFGKSNYEGGITPEKAQAFLIASLKKSAENCGKDEMQPEHLILCGGLASSGRDGARAHRLSITGVGKNIELRIEDISRTLVTNIPDVLTDLLELAAYVYCADGTVRRGGSTMARMGRDWRRRFRFVVPVRRPDVWSAAPISTLLIETLSFLSDDFYEFEFQQLADPPIFQKYLELGGGEPHGFESDEVALFSGGLDSLAGAIDEFVNGRRVVLVSHWSAPKIVSRQAELVKALQTRFGRDRLLHVPVWVYKDQNVGKEFSQRSRSFLFAALAFVVAQIFGLSRLRFFESEVVSLNLPIVAHELGARASRTTHPQAISGFTGLFSALARTSFTVQNPFLWSTKSELVRVIGDHRCAELIRQTVSCARVREMTVAQTHCGVCSQCVDRRFSVLAAGLEVHGPETLYKLNLFTDSLPPGEARTMVEAYARTAGEIERMNDTAFFARFGEVSRALRFIPEGANEVGRKIFELSKRHAGEICEAIRLIEVLFRQQIGFDAHRQSSGMCR